MIFTELLICYFYRELLEEREKAESKCSQFERKYAEMMSQISSVLRIEENTLEYSSIEELTRSVSL